MNSSAKRYTVHLKVCVANFIYTCTFSLCCESAEKKQFRKLKFSHCFFLGGIMAKYVCTLCGWIYDPAEGDPDGGVAPGTAFEDIPEDWVCPVCGATKSAFEKV